MAMCVPRAFHIFICVVAYRMPNATLTNNTDTLMRARGSLVLKTAD
jgi:hypothetical protein